VKLEGVKEEELTVVGAGGIVIVPIVSELGDDPVAL
jgi:hypothetical protein